MGRISRMCYESTFFHVMTQGIKKEYIFKRRIDKRKYMNDLQEKSKEYNVIILGYCIMDNHAHLLLYAKEIKNLTKMMSSINTKYAIYYNKSRKRCGFVFRDRYRCENIVTQNYLENCLKYIHNNPVEAKICDSPEKYKYSSFNDFMNQKVSKDILKIIFGEETDYKKKLNGESENYHFIDIENQFGETGSAPIKDVFAQFSNCDFRDKSEIFRVTNILKKKCNASNDEIIKLLNLKRATFYNIMKNFRNT